MNNDLPNDLDADFDDEGPSKSQLKREALALTALGEQLTQLSNDKLQQLGLPGAIEDAVAQARDMKASGARKRQLQFLGKLLRHEDPAPIQEAIEKLEQASKANHQLHHQAEAWRDRILADNDQIQAFVGQYPHADRQQLRQLARAGNKEQQANQPPKSARKLFRLIRDTIGGSW
jgi:ribosome-associated protein